MDGTVTVALVVDTLTVHVIVLMPSLNAIVHEPAPVAVTVDEEVAPAAGAEAVATPAQLPLGVAWYCVVPAPVSLRLTWAVWPDAVNVSAVPEW